VNAARFSRFDGPAAVEVQDIEKPVVAPGKILVEVHAAGVNPFDWKITTGSVKMTLPATLGGDFAGVVVEAGPDVQGFAPGDEVYGQASVFNGGTGSFAEFDAAPARALAAKPKSCSLLEAAALPLAGASALQALKDHIGLERGQKILIHGGAGGIGSFALQIARHIGAHIATTVAGPDIDFARSLGADDVIDYTKERFEDRLRDFDAVLDPVAGETYRRSFAALKRGGVIVSMLEPPDEALATEHAVNAIVQSTKVTTNRLAALAALVDAGAVRAHIDKVFPLAAAGEALEHLHSKHPRGKVVIRIRD
jgi:NADPH:quinone reductase-like Zn-dependent oxidoreductase